MRKLIKKLILISYPWFWLLNKISIKKSARVLILHDVPQKHLSNFEKLLIELKNDFDFISPEDFKLYLQGKIKLKKQSLLLTFDDGFYSSKFAADQILNKLNIKAIFFICPQFIGLDQVQNQKAVAKYVFDGMITDELVSEAQLMMKQEHLMELIGSGHTIGSHSSSHLRLSQLNDEKKLQDAIYKSQLQIEELINQRVIDFAYPFGDIDSIHRPSMTAIKKDFSYCYSGVRGENYSFENPMTIKREAINLADHWLYSKFICLGGLSWLYNKQRKRLLELGQ